MEILKIFLSVVFSVLLLGSETQSFSIETGKENPQEPDRETVTCTKWMTPMIGDVPDPFDCSRYYTCVDIGNGVSKPQGPRYCPGGLEYDFSHCCCNYPVDERCFQADNNTHVENQFKCTKPIDSDLPLPSIECPVLE